MKRLTNDELATRVRERNLKGTAAYRQRLSEAGKVQLAVWVPGELRSQIDTAAGLNSRTLSAECTALIQEGFEYRDLAK